MPVLPTLESSQSIFNTTQLGSQQINSSPADFGALTAQAGSQLGQAVQGAAADVNSIALQKKAINDETTTNATFYKNYFPLAMQATQSYLAKQGQDAATGYGDYQKQMEDLRVQVRSQFTDPQQQRMFDEISRKTESNFMTGAAAHQTSQNQVYQDQTSMGMVAAAGQLAVQHWNDPNGFQVGLQSGINEIMTHSQFRGEPVEFGLKKVQDFTSQTYAERLNQMSNADPVGAYNLLKNGEDYQTPNGNSVHVDVQSKISAAILPQLTEQLQNGMFQVKAQSIANNIFANSTTPPEDLKAAMPGMVESARAQAEQEFPGNPKYANLVAANIENKGNLIIEGVTASQQQAHNQIISAIVGQQPNGSDGAKSMGQLMANPATRSAYYKMTPDGQLAVQNMMAKPSDEVNKWTPQSLQTYHKLIGMSVDQSDQFSQADLSKLFGTIPTQTLVQLTQLQGQIQKHDDSQASKQLNWQRTKGDVDDMLKPMGLGTAAPLHDTDKQAINQQFYGQLQTALTQYHDQKGQYPDTVETRKIAAGLLTQGTQQVPGMLFGTNTQNVMNFQSKNGTFTVPIPDDKKAAAAASFQRVNGRTPSDAELNQAWTQYQLKQAGK